MKSSLLIWYFLVCKASVFSDHWGLHVLRLKNASLEESLADESDSVPVFYVANLQETSCRPIRHLKIYICCPSLKNFVEQVLKLTPPASLKPLEVAESTLPVGMTDLKDEGKSHPLPDILERLEADGFALRHGIAKSVQQLLDVCLPWGKLFQLRQGRFTPHHSKL